MNNRMDMMFQGNDQSRRSIMAAAHIIEEFRQYNPRMEATQILCFLLIAARPGVTLKELEAKLDVGSSAISRNVLELSARGWKKKPDGGTEPGLDLVSTAPSPDDSRASIAFPTNLRGKRLVDRINYIIQGASEAHGTT